MVILEGLTLSVTGAAAGLIGALWATRLVGGLLYEVEPHDPATFVLAAALFFSVALAASLLPALRAMKVDPIAVLNRG